VDGRGRLRRLRRLTTTEPQRVRDTVRDIPCRWLKASTARLNLSIALVNQPTTASEIFAEHR
jgi:hypothetical protein